MDVLKYKPVIKKVLAELKVPHNQREDMSQECYIALIEKSAHLQKGIELGEENKYAAQICRSRVINLWRRNQHPYKTEDNLGPRLVSLSIPQIRNQAERIAVQTPDVTDEQLQEAILSLPFDEYRVVYSVYVDGKSQRETSNDFGISRRQVANLLERGVQNLKKYFEVN